MKTDEPKLEISVVAPCHNERDNLRPLVEAVRAVLTGRSFEIVLVDDGSADGSWELIKELGVRAVRFEQNAGQSAALWAGMNAARGRVIVTMDSDMQNPPSEIPKLLAELKRADCVCGSRVEARAKGDSWVRRASSRIANWVRNKVSGETISDAGCCFRAFRRECIEKVKPFKGAHRFLPTLIRMEGFTVVEVPVNHNPRHAGRGHYGVWNRLFKSSADLLAVRWMKKRTLRYKIAETIVLAFLLAASSVFAKGNADHVVVVVWDGMRPDFVSDTNTPTLAKLARDGVFFANHHSVFPSSTEVNGAAMATGALPNRNGVVANREYRPAIDPLKRIEIESMETIVKGDKVSGGHYLQLPTVPEILRRAGRRVAVAGTKPVALLFDRFERNRVKLSTAPKFDSPNTRVDAATTRALVGSLWDDGVPAFSLLWLSDPDATQHATAPGAEKALEAMKSVDGDLALVLQELEARGQREETDVFVVSDHGFSTVMRTIDVADALRQAGFKATRELEQPPVAGDVMVVGNGGSVLLYVIGHDKALTRKIVEFLQRQDYTGVTLTRERMPGTFTLDQARLNSPDAPDIFVSLRWTSETNQFGVAGMIVSDGSAYGRMSVGLGRGGHSSLSAYDMHNTLVAAGPDFPCGETNHFPSGNADLAPTILSILGVKPPQRMDGRVLTEAAPATRQRTLEAGRQYLKIIECGHAFYIDEGNAR